MHALDLKLATIEIPLPYGRFLYVLPLTRKPVEYAGYTFERPRR